MPTKIVKKTEELQNPTNSNQKNQKNIARLLIGSERAGQEYIVHFLQQTLPTADPAQPKFAKLAATMKNLGSTDLVASLGTVLDIHTVAPLEGKKDINLEQIDGLIGFATLRPQFSHFSVGIIYQAERLSLDSQGKLLKFLEEPAEYLFLFLISAKPQLLLPTITSRVLIDYLPLEEGEATVSKALTEAKNLVSDFTSLERKKTLRSYPDLAKLIDKQKTNREKQLILELCLAELKQGKSPASLQIANKLQKAIRYNANVKLTLDWVCIALLDCSLG